MQFEDRSNQGGQMFLGADVPAIGSTVIIPRWEHLKVTVISVKQLPGQTKLVLDWGDFGISHVWMHDEGKTWCRLSNMN